MPTERNHICVFDAYGTLFNVHSAVQRLSSRLGDRADSVSRVWRQKQLEYTWLRSLMGAYADFEQITADSLTYALTSNGIDDPALYADLLAGYRQLDCYPEVPEILQAIKKLECQTAILSNGTAAMIESCVRHAGIADWIDAVLTVDSVRIYKPSPRVYELAVDRFGPPPAAIYFLSANAWDIAGASRFGFTTIWINRSGNRPEVLPNHPTHVLPDLADLPNLLGSN